MRNHRGARTGNLLEVFARNDVVSANTAGGDDTVLSHADGFYLPATVEALVLAADAGAAFGSGNGLANTMLGNDAANRLLGVDGDDSLAGAAGDDSLWGQDGNDSLLGGLGDDWALGGAGADSLQGGQGNDTLHGEDGDDLLDGGAGRDWAVGGAGNDLYLVDDLWDGVVEQAGGGSDTVVASIAGGGFYLPAEVEALLLIGGTEFGVGNALSNTILGNAGDNRLFGGGGDDHLQGLDGADRLFGQVGNDTLDGGDGADQAAGGDGADRLLGGGGDDLLYGEAGADLLEGGDGIDWLLGGDGADSLLGGDGADMFYGEAGADSLEGGAGNDGAAGGSEADTLLGGDGDDSLLGEAGSDQLLGGAGSDVLIGGADWDTLDGGIGADAMAGGTGNDLYRIDNPGDQVIELAGEGYDTVLVDIAGGGFVLRRDAEIEALQLDGTTRSVTANGFATSILGNASANLIDAGGGADTIFAGAGDDTIRGGDGPDTFLFTPGMGHDLILDYQPGDVLDFDGFSHVVITWDHPDSVRVNFYTGDHQWSNDWLELQGDFGGLSSFVLGSVNAHYADLLIDAGEATAFGQVGTLYAYNGVFLTGQHVGPGGTPGWIVLQPPMQPGGWFGGVGTTIVNVSLPPIILQPLPPEVDAAAIAVQLATLTDTDGTGVLPLPGLHVGASGADSLLGSGGSDTLRGRHGADTLDGGQGDDLLVGGEGHDLFRFRPGGGHDTIRDAAGDDLVITSAAVSFAVEADRLAILSQAVDSLLLDGNVGGRFIWRGFDATGAEIERIEADDGAVFGSITILAPNLPPPAAGTGGTVGLGSGVADGSPTVGSRISLTHEPLTDGCGTITLTGNITQAGMIGAGGGGFLTLADSPFG